MKLSSPSLSASPQSAGSNILSDQNSEVCDNDHNSHTRLSIDFSPDLLNVSNGNDIQSESENVSWNNNLSRNNLILVRSNLRKELSDWATKRYVKRTVVTHILHILHPYHNELPLDSRTLLQTPRRIVTKSSSNGEYCHFGLVEGLRLKLMASSSNISNGDTIHISFNIDGLPVFHKGHK